MDILLEMRELIITFIKKFELPIVFGLKLLLGVIIYSGIANIGSYSALFSFLIEDSTNIIFYTLFMGFLFAVLPINANYLLIALNITMQFSANIELMLIVFSGLMVIYLFYAHIGKVENTLILAMFLGFFFHVPYAIPLFAGLYFGLTSIIPVAIGAFVWTYAGAILSLSTEGLGTVLPETIEMFELELSEVLETFVHLSDSLGADSYAVQQGVVFTVVFSISLVVVYIVSKLSINMSKIIAIGLGTITNIFGLFIGTGFVDLNIGFANIIIFNIISFIILVIVRFFDIILDYNRTERVEFEDEDYYYHVKVVPKIKNRNIAQTNSEAKTEVKPPRVRGSKGQKNNQEED